MDSGIKILLATPVTVAQPLKKEQKQLKIFDFKLFLILIRHTFFKM